MMTKLLPDKMLITGSNPWQCENFLMRIQVALQSNIKLVQLRAPELSMPAYLALAAAAQKLCTLYDAQLVLNFPITNPLPIVFDVGLHLTSRHLMRLITRPIEYQFIGASCHTACELAKAVTLGLDYALLSPVLATASHPQVKPLGWDKFAELVAPIQIPVYALGGMNSTDIPIAKKYGAQGIAGISGLWPMVNSIL